VLASDTTQVGSHLGDVDGHIVPAHMGSGDSHDNKNSHFGGHAMNHYWGNTSWFGNSEHAFDHGFLEGKNHSWGSVHGHGDRCETIPPVAAVPVPAAIWLFGSALMGLVGLLSRNRGSKALVA